MTKEANSNLFNEIAQQQFRFVYYIIALNVTAIGFSVYQTTGEEINYTHIFLGLAVILWGLSIFSGFQFLKYNMTVMSLNLSIKQLIDVDFQNSQLIEQKNSELEEKGKKVRYSSKVLQLFFYAGIASFLVWHVLNMIPSDQF